MSNLVAEIRNRFTYENGKLFWKNPTYKALIGKEAGYTYNPPSVKQTPHKRVHVQNSEFSKCVPQQHAVWMMFNGALPPHTRIVHKNGDTFDNRIENLELYNAKSK